MQGLRSAFKLQNEGLDRRPGPGEGLGAYVARLRGKKTRAEVAARAGIQASTIQRIENGSTTTLRRGTAGKLAIALEVPEEYLHAAVRGEVPVGGTGIKVCFKCWKPGTRPIEAWKLEIAKYCCLCGGPLHSSCTCGAPIRAWDDLYCSKCGQSYESLGKG